LRPNVSALCASDRDMTKSLKFAPPQHTRERTRSTQEDTMHTRTHTHYPSGKLLTFCKTKYTGSTMQFVISFTVLAITLMFKLICCSNLGAFFDSKYCWWFILAPITRDSNGFPLTSAQNFLQAQNEL
jgi:hypothetical protein